MWYYVRNGERVGPVNADEIERQIAAGAILADTLVWRAGLSGWMPAGATEWASRFPGAGLPPSAAASSTPSAVPAAATPSRPPSVTVFAILLLVFGGLALLCLPFSLWAVMTFGVGWPAGGAYLAWTRISAVLQLAGGLWQVAAGIGLLQLRRWARRAAVGYGVYAIATGLVGLIFQIHLIARFSGESRPEMLPGMVGGLIGGLIGMIFPILLIVFMSKPRAVEACAR